MTRSAKYLATLVLAAAALWAGYVAIWAWRNVTADHPMEYRENAVLLTSQLQMEGRNPYGLDSRPVYVNGYGIGYYWVSFPFVRSFGNSFLVLRLVSCAFMTASAGLLAWAMRRNKVSWRWSLAAALVWFSQLGQGMSLLARPDGVGLFFFLASVVVPHAWRFSPASLGVSAALSILGFLTKAYFVLGLPIVFLYLLLFENKWKALAFGVVAGMGFVLTQAAIHAIYECYFTETFFAQASAVPRSGWHLLRVGGQFLLQNSGFVLVLLVGAAAGIKRALAACREGGAGTALEPRPGPAGLLTVRMDFPAFILAITALAMALLLGWNAGNDVLYYHQLASPFLFWLVFKWTDPQTRQSWAAVLVIFVNVAWQGLASSPLPADHSAAWREADRLVASSRSVFAAPSLAHLLQRHGKPVYDTGQTEWSRYGFEANVTRVAEEYLKRTVAFLKDLEEKIRAEEFDLVLVSRDLTTLLPLDELVRHYAPTGRVSTPMTFGYWVDPFPIEAWVPRRARAAPP